MVTDITVQNPGSGYLAPPQVNILGNGSGARAEAVLGPNGSVTGINVINGGSGYWPIPIGGPGSNGQINPIPPNNSGAFVAISTGYVVNLMYR